MQRKEFIPWSTTTNKYYIDGNRSFLPGSADTSTILLFVSLLSVVVVSHLCFMWLYFKIYSQLTIVITNIWFMPKISEKLITGW